MAGGAAGAALATPAAIPVAVTPSAAVMVAPATSCFTFKFIVQHLSCEYRRISPDSTEVSYSAYDPSVEQLITA
jgi:hypothetical protein